MTKTNKQNKPQNAVIELTFGCNRRCKLCFRQVRHLKRGEYYFMNLSTAKKIADSLKVFDPMRLQFDYRGEPLLNPHWKKIIRLFRKKLPNSQIHLITNGDFLDMNIAKQFFKIGGNILSVDCYDGTFKDRVNYYISNDTFTVHIDGKDDFQPYARHNPNTTREMVLIPDNFHTNKKGLRQWNNLAGNLDYKSAEKLGMKPLEKPLFKPCILPFKDLAIRYNGDIRLCCLDGENNNSIFGNIHNIDIEDFWYNNKRLNLIRTLLYNKLRIHSPCNRCDYGVGGVFSFIPKYKRIPEPKLDELKQKYYDDD